LIKAEECLNAARSILTDVNGYTIETFLFHVTQFELLKHQIKNASRQNDLNVDTLRKFEFSYLITPNFYLNSDNEALHEINCAIECLPLDSYPILEQRLFREATLFANNTLNDKSMANTFAERYLSVKCEYNVNFCWFVL
jgi:hypothetical protein